MKTTFENLEIEVLNRFSKMVYGIKVVGHKISIRNTETDKSEAFELLHVNQDYVIDDFEAINSVLYNLITDAMLGHLSYEDFEKKLYTPGDDSSLEGHYEHCVGIKEKMGKVVEYDEMVRLKDLIEMDLPF